MPEIQQTNFSQYLLFGGVGLAVLALVIYFLPWGRLKLPAIVVGILSGLAAGVGVGILLMEFRGYHWEQAPPVPQGGPPSGMDLMIQQMTEAGGPKMILATLVSKLDLLTRRPLELTPEQKKRVLVQLRELGSKDWLSDEEANKRLGALHNILKDARDALEAVGYQWPGTQKGGSRPSTIPPNPFKEREYQQHLKALQERLTRGEKKVAG